MAARQNDADSRALIGKRIRDTRLRLGLSQKAFADRIGASEGSVGLWERGKARPELHLRRLAETTNVSESWILYGNEADKDAGALVERLAKVEWLVVGTLTRMDRELMDVRERFDDASRVLERLDAQGDRIETNVREFHTDAFTRAVAATAQRSPKRAEGKSTPARSRRQTG
jgi:transcriptional regulator with XRE-family HTH domain